MCCAWRTLSIDTLAPGGSVDTLRVAVAAGLDAGVTATGVATAGLMTAGAGGGTLGSTGRVVASIGGGTAVWGGVFCVPVGLEAVGGGCAGVVAGVTAGGGEGGTIELAATGGEAGVVSFLGIRRRTTSSTTSRPITPSRISGSGSDALAPAGFTGLAGLGAGFAACGVAGRAVGFAAGGAARGGAATGAGAASTSAAGGAGAGGRILDASRSSFFK